MYEMIKKFRNHIEEGIEKKTLNNADLEYYQDLIDGYTKLIPMIKGRMTKAKKK